MNEEKDMEKSQKDGRVNDSSQAAGSAAYLRVRSKAVNICNHNKRRLDYERMSKEETLRCITETEILAKVFGLDHPEVHKKRMTEFKEICKPNNVISTIDN